MTPELILKRYERGMTAEQIATLDNLSLAHVEEVISSSGVHPVERPEPLPVKKQFGPAPHVPDEKLISLYHEGLTIYGITRVIHSSHSNVKRRLVRLGLIDQDGTQLVAPDASLAARETAVTLEGEGFSERYTIAQLSKEELDMTEAIAEARNTAKDKWVHYVAHQIDNARIKTKFDVVEQDGKLIKQTEVRFVIEEEMR
ncbi:hypothetical protein [uncultured Exiguobacterium sp.]|uniref:hypothetical protein n=1 Tax=uncultured Exiguobacterium sp. TaxID=202669 RepID=UPI0025E813A5|nr:hypothetical protein [uncultured Exiguobacterium sp.]